MGFDTLIEQLAFGRSLPKFRSCLGLYLSPDVAFLSEAHMHNGKPVVDHLLRIPVPAAAAPPDTQTRLAGSLNAEILPDPDKVGELLKQAMGQMRWGSQYLMVSVSHYFGLLRYFPMPKIERRFWKMAVPIEAKKYIPIPFSDLVYGYQVSPLPPGPDRRPRQGTLFGVIHRKNMDMIAGLAQKLNLSLVGVEIGPCSVGRLWNVLDASAALAPYMEVFIEGGAARILQSEAGIPIFFREMQLSQETETAERREIDLAGSIDFTRKQLGVQKPSEIRLEISTPDFSGWKETFAQETGLPVRVQDTAKSLGLKAGDWGGYASIGCALRHLASTPVTLTLGQSGQVNEEDCHAAYGIFSAAGVLAALLLMIGGIRWGLVLYKEYQLARLQRGTSIQAFEGKTADQIQKLLQDMQQRADSLYAFATSKTRVTQIFEDLAEATPDSVWITLLTYSNDMAEGVSNFAQTVSLSGHTLGPNAMAEQDMAVRFRDQLQGHAHFGKIFTCGGVSIQTRPELPGLTPSGEARTTFKVDCSSRKR